MPGIPLSNRCSFCKRRKIKCDENWPRCGNCKRSNQECSGPPKGVKFVQNNCHSARGNNSRLSSGSPVPRSQAPSPCGTLVDVKLQSTADGTGTFHQMKIVRDIPQRPREVTPTSEEKLAAKLAQAMAASDTSGHGNALLLSHELLGFIGGRISESSALSDALACLLATFGNLKRALPFQDLIDLQTYGRALKSLQKAARDPQQQHATATLAAATVLYQIEVAYDSSKGPNKALHCGYIYSTMTVRGPPSLEDMLDVHLAFENEQPMLSYCLLSGEDNFYASPEWVWTLQAALDAGMIVSPDLNSLYSLNMTISSWPYLASLLRTLHQDPLNPYATELAVELMNMATTLSLSLQTIDDTTIGSLLSTGDIFYLPSSDPETPDESTLEFSSFTTAQLFATHSLASIAANQILRGAMNFCGAVVDGTAFDVQNKQWTARLLRCGPYAARQKDSFLVPGLVMACGVAESVEERKTLVRMLREVEKWRYPCEKGLKGRWCEKNVLEMGMVLSGRGMFGAGQGGAVEFWS
ncbi:hypothetical protein GE09DRAFT_1227908 [Coniochaeta sp. 2T2.1]|nr:hypothetical protein GE09DRAFT_1227908 [Coniochaeta sp. 2T2.1]